MREFEGCLVRDVADGAGSRYDLRIRGHHARNICPYLEDSCLASDSIQRGCIVGTATSEGRRTSLLVRSDESRKHEELGHRVVLDHFVDAEICLLHIHDVLSVLADGADYVS